jgi:hypothetical protein
MRGVGVLHFPEFYIYPCNFITGDKLELEGLSQFEQTEKLLRAAVAGEKIIEQVKPVCELHIRVLI